jgi:hypothetical protein
MLLKNKKNILGSKILLLLRMPSSGLLLRVALVRTDVSKERSASIIRVTRIGEAGTTLSITIYSQHASIASYG